MNDSNILVEVIRIIKNYQEFRDSGSFNRNSEIVHISPEIGSSKLFFFFSEDKIERKYPVRHNVDE